MLRFISKFFSSVDEVERRERKRRQASAIQSRAHHTMSKPSVPDQRAVANEFQLFIRKAAPDIRLENGAASLEQLDTYLTATLSNQGGYTPPSAIAGVTAFIGEMLAKSAPGTEWEGSKFLLSPFSESPIDIGTAVEQRLTRLEGPTLLDIYRQALHRLIPAPTSQSSEVISPKAKASPGAQGDKPSGKKTAKHSATKKTPSKPVA